MAFLSEVRGRFFYCSHNLGSPEAEMISFSFHFLRCGGEKIFENVKLCDGRVYARWTNGKRDGGLCFSIPLHKGFFLPPPTPLSPPLKSYEQKLSPLYPSLSRRPVHPSWDFFSTSFPFLVRFVMVSFSLLCLCFPSSHFITLDFFSYSFIPPLHHMTDTDDKGIKSNF